MPVVYTDGIFDLFHVGHVEHFQKLKKLNDVDPDENVYLIVGIIGDKAAENYKRKPIYNENNRKILVESCKYVDKVVENAPLYITEEFIKQHNIDWVCHAFFDKKDFDKQCDFYKICVTLGKFKEVEYSYSMSTTEIIQRVKDSK